MQHTRGNTQSRPKNVTLKAGNKKGDGCKLTRSTVKSSINCSCIAHSANFVFFSTDIHFEKNWNYCKNGFSHWQLEASMIQTFFNPIEVPLTHPASPFLS